MTDATSLDIELLAEILEQLGPVCLMSSVRSGGEIVDFRYELVNRAFCETVGEPADVLQGARLIELYPSHVDLGLFDAYRNVVDTGEPYVSELPWFDERNLRAFLEVRVTRFRDGYLMTGRDITAAKLGEQMRSIFDATGDGIVTIDAEGRITAWNAGAETLFGHRAAEAIGRHIEMLLPDTIRAEQIRLIDATARGDVVLTPFETTRVHSDGSVVHVEISAAPIRSGDGTPIGVSMIHRDLRARDAEQGMGLGQPVEVWCNFTASWVGGYRFERAQADGSVLVRREWDRNALPRAFSRSDVRPAEHGRRR